MARQYRRVAQKQTPGKPPRPEQQTPWVGLTWVMERGLHGYPPAPLRAPSYDTDVRDPEDRILVSFSEI